MHGRIGRQHVRDYHPDDLALLEQLAQAEARESFWAFRQHINPNMIKGWWQREIAAHLQQFYEDMIAGKRPVLGLMAPPQHGKSKQVEDFLAWCAGKQPHWKEIFASFSDDLGIKTNMALQRTFTSPRYTGVFPETRISDTNVVTQIGRFLRNSSMIEFVEKGGSFRNTTVNGQINGQEMHLGAVDDPIKGRKEANSPTVRESAWGWMTDDLFSRMAKDAGLLVIMTRWHVDDPMGRLQEFFPRMKVLRYPAIAERDERFRKKGEALFPEHKPLDFLLERKGLLTQAGWESVYQQNPIIVGGGMFPVEEFGIVDRVDPKLIATSVRYWDKAGTEDGGKRTAGVLMHKLRDGRHYIEDCVSGQWGALERERIILATAKQDHAMLKRTVYIYVEQEPGSGGKESAENSVRMLAQFVAKADKVTDSKEARCEPYAAQVQAGNILLKAAPWTRDFKNEHEVFPAGKFKDRVDAASGAYNKLNGPDHQYDVSQSNMG